MGKYFGTSGIRGLYGKKIDEDLAYRLGKAVSEFVSFGKVIIARDTRISGPSLRKALLRGLKGCEIVDVGVVPTPVLSFSVSKLGADIGIMITASHNPSEYNGFKLWDSKGLAFTPDKEEVIEESLDKVDDSFSDDMISVDISEVDIDSSYIKAIHDKVELVGKMKVLIDCGDGAAWSISPKVLRSFGCDIVEVNCSADGSFPARNPEPNAANLVHTAELVKSNGCDVGFAHDGDADRMMAIDDEGNVVDFDKFLAFLCTGLDPVVITVDASMAVENHLSGHNGPSVVRAKVGDVPVAAEVARIGAKFGGEPSGSYIFPEFGLWPDGIYGIVKVLSFLEKDGRKLSEILSGIDKPDFVRVKIKCPNSLKSSVMEEVKNSVPSDCETDLVDGVLMKGDDYMILIRPSGTEEYIRLNVEADGFDKVEELRAIWEKKIIGMVNNDG